MTQSEHNRQLSPQCERILKHLQQKGSITFLEGWQFCGVMNVRGRIHELRRAGYGIETTWVERYNKFAEKVHVAKYVLKDQ